MNRRGESPPGDSSPSFVIPTSTVGSVLRELRVNAGLSRSALSQRTGISHQMIENFECNRVPPSYSNIRALAPVLGTNEGELLAQAGYVPRTGHHEPGGGVGIPANRRHA